MAEEDKNKKSTIDKIIMGAIIGTAVGSAIGMSMAPQEGKKTREMLKEKTKDISKDVKEVGSLTKETSVGFFRLARNLFFGKKKKDNPSNVEEMKKIPDEMEIIPPEYVDRD